jgi:hypothetical protein
MGHVAAILEEALTTYKNWDVYHHAGKGVGATS